MIAARHHHHIVVVRCHAGIQAAVIGIHSLECEALRRIETVIVGLFQLGLFARLRGIVFMRRPGAGGAFVGIHLHHQQTVGLRIIRQDIVHQTLITPFATMLNAHILRTNHPRRQRTFTRRAAHRQFKVRIRRHFHLVLRRDVHRPRRGTFKRRHALSQPWEVGLRRFDRRQPGNQHQTQLAFAAFQRNALPFFQHPHIKTDIAPAGALRRDVLDLPLFS